MENKFIAYPGLKFTIEWYFDDRGKSDALEFFKELSVEGKKKTFYLFKSLADTGQIFNEEKFRHEGDQIYAFKPSPERFLCFFFEGSKVIVTNAYHKKTQKLPAREKERALKTKKDYIKRYKEGHYYE